MFRQGLLTIFFISLFCTASFAANDESTLKQGKVLYDNACSACHSPKKANGLRAPAAFDVAAWKALREKAVAAVKAGEYKSVDAYFLRQIKIGRGLMHHGGLCRETSDVKKTIHCNDADYLAAIEYMSHSCDAKSC